ncbi:MAG: glycoside hydrolase family 92 protein [Paludibacter sp.]|nr:glycoside hydrolase family 92 protein [Paludibacter sp.]
MLFKTKRTILVLWLTFIGQLAFSGNVCDYVNLFMGTAGDHGQVDPAACVPYGMVRIAPDCNPRSHSGYDYNVTEVTGFSINRISGIGCDGAGGNLCIRPATKDEKVNMIKKTEEAFPGYYTVELDNGVRTEFTATDHVGFQRYHYPKGVEQNMNIDFYSSFGGMVEASYEVISLNEVEGYIHAKNTCGHGAYKLFFYLKTNADFIVTEKSDKSLSIRFSGKDAKTVELRLALSPIDEKTAQDEFRNVADLSFKQVKNKAEKDWRNLLSKVKVSGSKEEKTLFYTSLYRVFLTPANVTSVDGQYLGTDGKVYDQKDFTYYSSWSIWDTYRTKFPLMTLLDAGRMKDIASSLCKLYVNGKKDWATKFESTPTVRTEHAATVVLDAYKKGIKGINLAEAYEGIKSEVENWPMNRPDQILEGCIDIWTLSEIAGILDKKADSIHYAEKAREIFQKTWNHDFKTIDESFSKMRDNGLYQGTRWQYRWALPQYQDIMSESIGGEDKLANELDYFFRNNLNNQGNEPGIHAPFIFNRLHQPQKTQQYVNHILHDENINLYGGNAEYPEPVIRQIFRNTPDGYLPEMDEDDGTMSAWYVFSTLGIFPLVVGDPVYELTSPSFNHVTIRFYNGHILDIDTKNRKSIYSPAKEVKLNGKTLTDFEVNHADLIQGGKLVFYY